MKEAVVDSRVRDALKRRDTKKEALEAVGVYLKEESAKMGPAFLELVAEAIRGSKRSGVDPPSVALKEKGCGSLAKGGVSGTKLNPLTSPEVMKVKEGISASCMGLQTVIRDPLPDAVALAAEVSTSVPVGMENFKQNADLVLSSVEEGAEDEDDDGDGDALTRRKKNTETASRPNFVGRNATRVQITEGKRKIGNYRRTAFTEDAGANSSGSGSKDNDEATKNHGEVQKCSIMDWNPTARAYEWEEDSDSSSSELQNLTRKPHLPSSKKGVVSPLKVQGNRNLVGRRKKLRWTTVEEDTLRKAVEKYGKGCWKLIKSCHPDIFEDKTEVDLKDKWRNMNKD
ncbi:Myb domain-containing protein [Dioscorea alata]|uniref:Myb domain-containing protein n=1 Tax=Dioscorea alata TaxID=55571 RepID=A0ACB7VNE4_DIOAL|nr:Myb domain-containing protein [Dioscorea alata]